jgi:hypothetical protein
MTRLFKTLLVAGTVGMGLLTVGAGGARADIVPKLVGSPTVDGSNFTWTYDAILRSDQYLVPGNFFTIYDFAGYTGVHSQPVGWSLFAENSSTPPPFTIPPDNAGIINLRWVWEGPGNIVPPTPGQDFDLGDFTADSTFSQEGLTAFASAGVDSDTNTVIGNAGWAVTPVVPEPCTMALLGLGGLPLLGGLRRRSRKA